MAKRQGDHRLIRLSKRYDLDLITMYRSGISLGKILTKALSAYAKDKPFSVIIEPVSNVELTQAVTIRKRIDKATGVEIPKPIPIEIGYWINDDATNDVLSTSHIRSVYGNEFCKQLLRHCILNAPLSVYMRTDTEVSEYVSKHSESFDFDLKDNIAAWIQAIATKEEKEYQILLEKSGPEVYIADRQGNLFRKSDIESAPSEETDGKPEEQDGAFIEAPDIAKRETTGLSDESKSLNEAIMSDLNFFG